MYFSSRPSRDENQAQTTCTIVRTTHARCLRLSDRSIRRGPSSFAAPWPKMKKRKGLENKKTENIFLKGRSLQIFFFFHVCLGTWAENEGVRSGVVAFAPFRPCGPIRSARFQGTAQCDFFLRLPCPSPIGSCSLGPWSVFFLLPALTESFVCPPPPHACSACPLFFLWAAVCSLHL